MQQSATPLFCDNCGNAVRPGAKFCSFCSAKLNQAPSHFVSVQPTKVLPTPTVLQQRYTITKQLGAGGFGAVYQARDTRFRNRVVAIKEMLSTATDPQEQQEEQAQFEHEAELLSELNHSALPQIHDYFEELGKWYIVMEFVEGQTLEEYIEQQPGKKVPFLVTIAIAAEIAKVLDVLHSQPQPIIFRDLKPANIMITTKGQKVKLIDFGIARVFKQGQSKDTVALGSPGYAAPEQYGKAQSTGAVDVYALASVMYRAYTGKDPAHIPFQYDSVYDAQEPASATLQELLELMHALRVSERATLATVQQVLSELSTAWPNVPQIRIEKDTVTPLSPSIPQWPPTTPPPFPGPVSGTPAATSLYVPSKNAPQNATTSLLPQGALNQNIWMLYHPKDKRHVDEIKKQMSPLKRYQGVEYTLWENDEMQPGAQRIQELEQRALKARLFMVYFSHDLLADDFWMGIIDTMVRPQILKSSGKKTKDRQILFPIRVVETALDSDSHGVMSIWSLTALPHRYGETLNNLKGTALDEMYIFIVKQMKRVLTDPNY